jgi:DMSO/TMAO reductase YedYZ molybdopterin-dependent catalytic subunit
MRLPPGQRAVEGFPRFGTHLHRPPPAVPAEPVIEVHGTVSEPLVVRLTDLASLPRQELVADFHCVAGWSAVDLRWEGVPFGTFYRAFVEPWIRRLEPVTHAVFGGLDGYRWTGLIEDALSEDVLIADRLDGCPLDADHGAPARLVSPSQYGHASVKHLCRIEVLTAEPPEHHHAASSLAELALRSSLIKPHPRARVWKEERHRYLPGRAVRPAYRLITPPITFLSRHRRPSEG